MKAYSKPELNVLHIGKEICTDIIVASGEQSFGDINVERFIILRTGEFHHDVVDEILILGSIADSFDLHPMER